MQFLSQGSLKVLNEFVNSIFAYLFIVMVREGAATHLPIAESEY
jgi:hypothetical protein